MKEIIEVSLILVAVCTTSIVLQKYLEKTSDEILFNLNNLKDEIILAKELNSTENLKQVLNDLMEKWEEISKVWSMVVAHQELDNIKLSILEIKGAIESSSLEDAIEEIEKTIFLAGHIKEKESFRLKNIF